MNHDVLLRRLRDAVGAEQVLVDPCELGPYLLDWRERYRGAALAVVRPRTTQEVSEVVRACAEAEVSVVPQGGNTSLCGGATPLTEGVSVIVSLTLMDRVLDVDARNNTVFVEAGCTLAAVQAAARAADRLFPLALAPDQRCEIGGNISTNAGGVQVLRYGSMRDFVLGLEVVLPDGRVWNGLRALRKDNAGYDLKQLFIGAEGTLGIVTRAVLKLFAQPRARATAWVTVPNPASAVELLRSVQQRLGESVTAFELIGREALQLVAQHIPQARIPVAIGEWAVLVETSGPDDGPRAHDALAQTLGEARTAALAYDFVLAADEAQAEDFWRVRKQIAQAQKLEGWSIKHDISLPVSRLADYLERADAVLHERWPDIRVVVFGHVGDGNLHYNLSLREEAANPAFVETPAEANRLVYELVAELEGSIAAEHGLGQLKRETVGEYRSPIEIELMRTIKKAFDPNGTMNPGKVV